MLVTHPDGMPRIRITHANHALLWEASDPLAVYVTYVV